MKAADLALWTPIALDVGGGRPTIDWCDLRDVAFSEPFFDQTVERWRATRQVVRTDLDVLLELDSAPSLEPAGVIFHMSRCGSTLVTRLLQTLNEVVVVVEPGSMNALLRLDPERVDEQTRVRVLRLLVRALGRIRAPHHKQLVLKLSSWNVRRAGLIKAAFPGAPTLWLQRMPSQVAASLDATPPGWLSSPAAFREIFGLNMVDTAAREPPSHVALLAMLTAAQTLEPDRVLDYTDLPEAIWAEIGPLFGLSLGVDDIERMQLQARFSAKSGVPLLFEPKKTLNRSEIAHGHPLQEVYGRLDAARSRLDRSGSRRPPCSS